MSVLLRIPGHLLRASLSLLVALCLLLGPPRVGAGFASSRGEEDPQEQQGPKDTSKDTKEDGRDGRDGKESEASVAFFAAAALPSERHGDGQRASGTLLRYPLRRAHPPPRLHPAPRAPAPR